MTACAHIPMPPRFMSEMRFMSEKVFASDIKWTYAIPFPNISTPSHPKLYEILTFPSVPSVFSVVKILQHRPPLEPAILIHQRRPSFPDPPETLLNLFRLVDAEVQPQRLPPALARIEQAPDGESHIPLNPGDESLCRARSIGRQLHPEEEPAARRRPPAARGQVALRRR